MTKQEKNGQREIMTEAEVKAFLGDDYTVEGLEELVLDIVNNIYSVEDFVGDVRDYNQNNG